MKRAPIVLKADLFFARSVDQDTDEVGEKTSNDHQKKCRGSPWIFEPSAPKVEVQMTETIEKVFHDNPLSSHHYPSPGWLGQSPL